MKSHNSIIDVARKAGVSIATVSRVINDVSIVREDTRQKVLNAIEELNFSPNAIARVLVTRKTHTIGMIIPDISNPIYSEASRGIEEIASKNKYNLIFCNTNYLHSKELKYINIFREYRIEGLILATAEIEDNYVSMLKREKFPCVLLFRQVKDEDINFVVVDNEKGAFKIVQHLITLGYKRIGHITGPANISCSQLRLKGYKRALEKNSLKFSQDFCITSRFEEGDGYKAMQKLLDRRMNIEAVFCANDLIAFGAIRAIKERRLRIPDDVAVVGFDDIKPSSYTTPALTTVNQPSYQMGSLSAEILINMIRGDSMTSKRVILEPEIIIRESCGLGKDSGQRDLEME